MLAVASLASGCSRQSPTSPSPQGSPSPAPATTISTYVHDCAGLLALVNVTTGSTIVIGDTRVPLTDVAATPQGVLYGITFDGLYTIDTATATARRIGAHEIPGGNALASGPDGTLYGAGFESTQLYRLDIATGRGIALRDMGHASFGDLAFAGSSLYLASLSNDLIRVGLSAGTGSTVVGRLSFPAVLGLAGTVDGALYAVSGNQVARINPQTAATISVATMTNPSLTAACGQSAR